MKSGALLLRDLRTVKELAADLRFPSEKACRSWLHRQRIPFLKRGRVILIDPRDVEAKLRKGVA
jgi:hypothetical protein